MKERIHWGGEIHLETEEGDSACSAIPEPANDFVMSWLVGGRVDAWIIYIYGTGTRAKLWILG